MDEFGAGRLQPFAVDDARDPDQASFEEVVVPNSAAASRLAARVWASVNVESDQKLAVVHAALRRDHGAGAGCEEHIS